MSHPQQNLKNHARYVPLFHFLLFGLAAVNFVHAARKLFPFSADSFYPMVVATALVLMCWYIRAFPLTVQDRVIRLEEMLRLRALAPELAPRMNEIQPDQWTALRFAGDAELPALVREVLAGKLTRSADIKRAIKSWRPDDLRA